jgi:chromosome transmission fidelity protein 1
VVDQARAVVLVGGTLSPIDELAAQLFPDCAPVRGGSNDADTSGDPVAKTSADPSPSEAENDRNALRAELTRPTFDRKPLFSLSVGHVVPNDALLPLAVGTGPSGLTLDFSFGKRDDEKMIDELGRIVCNACAVTPGGAVVFFPSFAYADKVYTRWTHTGLLQRIARLKTVFREPRNAADVETALRSFSDAVARFSVGSDVVSSSVSTATATAVYKPSQTGALMLCVCGGKLSEGINFKDALGRLVVMVGLPYANPEEPELKARVAYLDEREGAFFHDAHKNKLNERGGFKTRGRRYYEALCMRSVNQSVGRAIRHVGDYAAILLCDRRYVTAPEVATSSSNTTNEGERDQVEKKNLRGVPAQLAGWIGERLVTPSGYGQTQASLARFFAGKRKNRA